MTDESLVPFHWNRRRLPRKQSQHECSSKANRQLVKRNRPSSSGGTDLRISSRNTSTRNGIMKQEIPGNPTFLRRLSFAVKEHKEEIQRSISPEDDG
ncbi:unnamed protein product [Protopolystoma xenopodis]|uniref:Uncharacterized protein n=1 Tax=Protopolystoma xenopodis TaxID=117903 RepID=A0A3S5ADU1_9PLAT|nr:unnamed protein product [Protopolystoma xenopodis]